jgi:AcrR family transcriptional regulator
MVRPRGPKKKPKKSAKPKTGKPRRRYHHGNLREALIDATLRLIEESGPERVTVREAATRAGVSSGAPFRHFPTRTALLTAVAEQSMARFRAEIVTALDQAADDEPLARFYALGTAYLRWASRNPTHFRVISDRSLVDLESSESLRRDNAEIRELMERLLAEAQRGGLLRTVDVTLAPVAARALVYGLARMYVDGHHSQWDSEPQVAERQMEAALHLFAESLRATVRADAPPAPLPTDRRPTSARDGGGDPPSPGRSPSS